MASISKLSTSISNPSLSSSVNSRSSFSPKSFIAFRLSSDFSTKVSASRLSVRGVSDLRGSLVYVSLFWVFFFFLFWVILIVFWRFGFLFLFCSEDLFDVYFLSSSASATFFMCCVLILILWRWVIWLFYFVLALSLCSFGGNDSFLAVWKTGLEKLH